MPQKHPFIIIANHSSHLDTVAIMNLFPLKFLSRIHPVAAADYFNRNTIVSFVSRLFFNILPIERKHICHNRNPLDAISAILAAGSSIILFPEGTRSLSGEIAPFHSGIAHVAKQFPIVPIIPVYMSNMWRALPKGEFIILPFICEMNIGKPIYPDGSKEEIMEILRNTIVRLKGESSWQ
ncbi:MAG: 1-acyl-sn-glycerol-3-phosphate acyltransferase [Candidatus Omnitrophica bacterium]|nr:1-acyl-sn-glycerol-3-phosphate acyltransferase [Candidatus Omnitrophota bacterium]